MQQNPPSKQNPATGFNAAALPENERLAAFHQAAMTGDLAMMSALKKTGMDIHALDDVGHNALMLAVMKREKKAVAQLLDWQADVNTPMLLMITPLTMAVMGGGDIDIATMLLEKGAEPDFKADGDTTALMMAAADANVPMIALLAKHKASPNLRDAGGNTAMMLGAMQGDTQAMEALHAMGANIFTANNDGASPIHMASQKGGAAAFDWLVEKGARLTAKDAAGKSVAAYAAAADNARALEDLIARKIAVDEPDNSGTTPLMAAAGQGAVKAAGILLQTDIALDAVNNDRRTARRIAEENGQDKIIALIDAAVTARLKSKVANDVSQMEEGVRHKVTVSKPLRIQRRK